MQFSVVDRQIWIKKDLGSRTMRKKYFWTLMWVTAATLLFATPGLAVIATILSLGLLLIPLFPLPMICIVFWIFLPSVFFWKNRLLRLILFVLPVGAIAAAIYFPPQLALKEAEKDVARRNIELTSTLNISKPIGIEIHRAGDRNPDLFQKGAFYDQNPCFELCERLLTGGNVAWIRLVIDGDYFENAGNLRSTTSVMVVPGTLGTCNKVNPDFEVNTRCALYAVDDGTPADIRILLDEKKLDSPGSLSSYYRVYGERTATAYRIPIANQEPLFRLNQLIYQYPIPFVHFDFDGIQGGNSGGFRRVYSVNNTEPVDLMATVQKLGLKIGPVRPITPKLKYAKAQFALIPPDAQDAAFAASVLAMRSNEFKLPSRTYTEVVKAWIYRLRYKENLSEGDRSILCLALASSNIYDGLSKDGLIKQFNIRCH